MSKHADAIVIIDKLIEDAVKFIATIDKAMEAGEPGIQNIRIYRDRLRGFKDARLALVWDAKKEHKHEVDEKEKSDA